jgi:hypothetical protein
MLAIALIITCAMILAIFLIYQPARVYMEPSGAQLALLDYAPEEGIIRNISVFIAMIAKNTNTHTEANFSQFIIKLDFNSVDIVWLRSQDFVVAPEGLVQLPYNVFFSGRPLDHGGRRAMGEALQTGLVPLDLYRKALTTLKVGTYPKRRFWTKISCRILPLGSVRQRSSS